DFKYLGAYVSSLDKEISSRITQSRIAFNKMNKIWKQRDLPLKLRIKFFMTTCLSILLYGCESWIINKKIENKLNGFTMNCYRYICGFRKIQRKRNEAILNIVGM